MTGRVVQITTNITKAQIGRLHGLAAKAGLKDGTREDNYHALLYTQTGKTSTKDLTYPEFLKMERHLGGSHGWSSPPKAPKPAPDGMIPAYMIKTAWRLFYELKRMDASPPQRSEG
ncbi:hypothetical protein FACS189425_03560 [Clostridia bacterium]|nr:hypothetical protein FACS189425_03560 [Clostridia bacterium]